MRLLRNKTLTALIGAVAFPLAALVYLAGLPRGGRNSLAAILLQVALVIGSVVLFGIFLARLVEQMNARRVRGWLASDEGQEWLDGLTEGERAEFLARLDGKLPDGPEAEPIDAGSSVDSPADPR